MNSVKRVWRIARKLGATIVEPELRLALLHGVLPTVEHAGVAFSENISTVIDVGANRGQFTTFALWRFPAARVFAFEPLPTACGTLRIVTSRKRDRVRIFELALGDSDVRAELRVAREDDSSSLLDLTQMGESVAPGARPVTRQTVQVTRLDNILAEGQLVADVLLKIDVQGYEQNVLEGARSLLSRVAEIFVECSFIELYRGQPLAEGIGTFLNGHGFELAETRPSLVRDGQTVQADLLFRRSKR
jgi:FkbM family methyltransferase